MSRFFPSYTIIVFLIGFFVGYTLVFCEPSRNKPVFINSEMFKIDAFGYSSLLKIY